MTEAEANGALILVVDDDDRSRELMRIVLRHAGYRVVAAPGPQAAIAMLATERPAAAVVDLLMPDMNGLEFCRWVREQRELASMGFVLLTGMDTQETRNDARDAGADAVVTKPFDRLRLLEQLGALLDPAPVATLPEGRKAR
jgi:two-component system alkaline phosphatase synthesis response regulator PhoP